MPARLLDLLSNLFCLGIMSKPIFRILPQHFAFFRFNSIIMIWNEATVKPNHRRWPLLKFRKGQFMVLRFWSHVRQLAVFTRTGATLVHAGAEAKTQVLYLCEVHGNLPANMMRF